MHEIAVALWHKVIKRTVKDVVAQESCTVLFRYTNCCGITLSTGTSFKNAPSRESAHESDQCGHQKTRRDLSFDVIINTMIGCKPCCHGNDFGLDDESSRDSDP